MTEAQKDPSAFRTISEAAKVLRLPQHVLRFWETKFTPIKPMKRAGGRRFYRPGDIHLLAGIKHLLYDKGYTIKGVQRIIKEKSVRHIAELGHMVLRGDEAIAHAPEQTMPEALVQTEAEQVMPEVLVQREAEQVMPEVLVQPEAEQVMPEVLVQTEAEQVMPEVLVQPEAEQVTTPEPVDVVSDGASRIESFVAKPPFDANLRDELALIRDELVELRSLCTP